MFSSGDNVWKLADFGFVTEGASNTAQPTQYARGTQCYQAPELVQESPVFNSKVDIWALGCILYELLFAKKAFESDYIVFEFSSFPRQLQLPTEQPPSIDEVSFTQLSVIIANCLNAEPSSRPLARDLYRLFSYQINPELSGSGHPDPQFPENGNKAQIPMIADPSITNATVSSPNSLNSPVSASSKTRTVQRDRMFRSTNGQTRRRTARTHNRNPVFGSNSHGSTYIRTGPNSFHYSNPDGSYFYKNEDGSTYFERRDGYWEYMPPD